MLNIRIHGISDGTHKIELSAPSKVVPYMFPEFFGDVRVSGELTKSGRRYKFTGKATCKANLVCDISATDYVEEIQTDLMLALIIDTELYFEQKKDIIDYDKEVALHEDDEYFDISELVKDELAVSLPMRRIAPEFKNKSFADLYTESTNPASDFDNSDRSNNSNNSNTNNNSCDESGLF